MSSAQGLGKKAVKNILTNAAAVTAIATGGIYSTQVRQTKAPPYILIDEEGMRPQDTKSDTAGSGASVNVHFLTVTAYAKNEGVMNNLAAAIDEALNHYTGTANGVTVADIRFINGDGGWVEDIHFLDMDWEVWTKK